MKSIRVMIVEDSPVARALLEQLVFSDPRLTLAGSYGNAESALRDLVRIAPDVISMDIHLPGMNGLEATRKIMQLRPSPIVVVSRSILKRDVELSIEALRAGALAVADKPLGPNQKDFEKLADRFCSQLVSMSEVRVIRQRFNEKTAVPPRPAPDSHFLSQQPHLPLHSSLANRPQALGIVASTGGPNALEVLLGSLPFNLPVPIFLVQHITSSFHRGFVDWLAQIAPMPVRTAEHHMLTEPGHLYVAPADRDLVLDGQRCLTTPGNPENIHCPSGNTMFFSMAEAFTSLGIGVVLTGMGDDGAAGLRAMKDKGALTIAEHECTTVVNGMPESARQINAVCKSLPLHSIGPAITRLFSSPVEVAS